MKNRQKTSCLVLGFILLCSGCYASVNAGLDVPVSELTPAKSAANAGVGQVIFSGRQGYFLNADGVQARLIGGVGEFMLEQVTPDRMKGDGKGRDFRVALLMAAVVPSDDGNIGTLTTLMIGPNFKKDYRSNRNFHTGLSPSVAISRLDIGDEIIWSLGLNFRAMSWVNASFF